MTSTGAAEPDEPTSGGEPDLEPVDGRRRRAERSRDAVLDAVLALYREGDPTPSVDVVAERAGVSRRSVFRHFDDLESLTVAALQRHLARIRPLAEPPPTEGDLASRAAALVARRRALYEEITPSRVVTQRLRGRPFIDEQIARARDLFRSQLATLFAEELGRLDEEGAHDRLLALEATTSWEAWHFLRADTGSDVDTVERLVAASVVQLLAGGATGR